MKRFPIHTTGFEAGAMRRRRAVLGAAVLAYALAPLLALRLYGPAAVDFAWDAAIGTGLAATGLLALLPLLSVRWWAAQSREADRLRVVQALHRQLSYLLAALLVAHAVGLVLLEPRVVEYLLPTAPGYMLAGLLALVLVTVLIVTSRARLRRRWSHSGWRRWHAAMSAAAIGLTGWHLWGAAYWVVTPRALLAAGWLLGVPTVLSLVWHRRPPARLAADTQSSPGPRCAVGASLVWSMLVLIVIAVAAFAWRPAADVRPDPHPYPCPTGGCL
ncbi:MAG: ferric reductase-like transmembrane domain-containing protein [Gammaproteobacteria bacterium]|nr:ferric reductase-like transmembrane domain-containing protein [Gammaproteobacteria bacterium]